MNIPVLLARVTTLFLLGLAMIGFSAGVAQASGVYAGWTISPEEPTAQSYSGRISFAGTGFPGANYTSVKDYADGESVRVVEGTDDYGDWFTTKTPFGAVFGPSGPSKSIQFFKVRIAPDDHSLTTYTFDRPLPANRLGFAFSDIDVDQLTLSATDAKGHAVPGSQLNGGTFNFCDVNVNRPTDCDGSHPTPVWSPGLDGGIVSPTPALPDVADTNGASAWFRPGVPIKTLTVAYLSLDTGTPSYRTWFAAVNDTRITTRLKLSKTRVKAGSKFRLTVRNRNRGPARANRVRSCVRIPKTLQVVKTAGVSASRSKYCWKRATIATRSTKRLSLTVRARRRASGRAKIVVNTRSANAAKARSKRRITLIRARTR